MPQQAGIYTPSGMKKHGAFENARNSRNADLFKELIRKAFDATDAISAHHLVYVDVDHRDGFDYQITQEIASADTLIFDHDAAKTLWGAPWKEVLCRLAIEPAETRDQVLARLWEEKKKAGDNFYVTG